MLLAPRRLSKFLSQQSNLPLSLELCFWKHFLFLSSAQSVGEVYIGNWKRKMECRLFATFALFYVVVLFFCCFLLYMRILKTEKGKMECRLLAAFAPHGFATWFDTNMGLLRPKSKELWQPKITKSSCRSIKMVTWKLSDKRRTGRCLNTQNLKSGKFPLRKLQEWNYFFLLDQALNIAIG